MAKCGVLENLELKEHIHTFINKGGDVRGLDFRFEINGRRIGAPFHGRGRRSTAGDTLNSASGSFQASRLSSRQIN